MSSIMWKNPLHPLGLLRGCCHDVSLALLKSKHGKGMGKKRCINIGRHVIAIFAGDGD